MKSFLHKLGGDKPSKDPSSLQGKIIQVSQFSVFVEEQIGAGGYASIYRVRDQPTQQTYALKHLRLPQDSDAVAEVRQEMRVMAMLGHHPNILKLHAASFAGPAGKETDAFMVMDFAPVTLLSMMQRSNFQLDDFFVHEVFSEVCHGIAHMHTFSPPYAHRDIKAENVLKTTKGKWVLCDFGSATPKAQVYETPAEIAMEEDVIRRTTTPAYRAPEMWDLMSRQRIDTKVDIWALGVLLYVLVFGKLPFQGDSKLSILFGKYEMPPGKNALMCDLIRDMLTTDPALRPDILTVLGRLDLIKQSLLQSVAGGTTTSAVLAAAAATQPQLPMPVKQHQPVVAMASKPVEAFNPTFDDPSPVFDMPPKPAAPPAQPAPQAPVHQRAHAPAQPQPHHPQQYRMQQHSTSSQSLQRHSTPSGQPTHQAAMQQQHQPPVHRSPPSAMYPSVNASTSSTLAPPAASPPQHSASSTWPRATSASLASQPQTGPGSRAQHGSPANTPKVYSNASSVNTSSNGAAPSSGDPVSAAASTPLFVPSEGALQLGATVSVPQPSSGSGSAATVPKLEPPPGQPPVPPATAELIHVDQAPVVPDADALLGATQSLLGGAFSPASKIKRGGAHRHKRSSSFGTHDLMAGSSQPDPTAAPVQPPVSGGTGFAADWGDAPAFSEPAAPSPAPLLNARSVTSSSALHAPPSMSLQSNRMDHPPAQPPPAQVVQQQSPPQAPPPQPSQRTSESGPSVTHPSVRTQHAAAFSHSRSPESRSEPHPAPSASSVSNNTASNSMPQGSQAMELEALRVQVKGLTVTQASLAGRVKQLEDLVAQQAAVIHKLQAALGAESSTHGSSRGKDVHLQVRHRSATFTADHTNGKPAGWHAFDTTHAE